ncbi:hypothetical protein A3D72_03360 [Candidatus Uhrbacteria bacterium RIFCSPHIGHO2_02_FULL_57_19]|uniref:Disintegrin domain-containing protein n=1 Tax=Candidatus Uhrbacteria bacterium RIFCSPHIGHO2_02_FULL_57_19 TaxID=1802391 RepID=A0A1F7U2K7_9BACT|nr:MAG: hypothetical protein A3D72_03360 [Candidatus Uhrbacteria bacterium RIFCSPHIGHO2_02_FULL_57_19]
MFRTVSDAPVYAVSEGHARHIVDQPLFFNIGYRDDLVLWVGDGTEDEVTLGIESEIDFDTIHQCENGRKERSTSDCVSCSEATEPGHGGECHDLDSDGYDDQVCGGTDCDDTRASVHPNAPEICDERDNNCMNGVDEQTDFDWDDQNCGECGEVCGGEYHCVDGDCEINGCSETEQCDDGVLCTNDSCQWNNTCRNNPLDTNCPDGEYCNQSLDCVDTSVCIDDQDCDDGEFTCTDDSCQNGLCHNTPNDNHCDWGHYCDPLTANCAYSDSDGDGTVDVEDCAPYNPNRKPGATEVCNNHDDDCDGLVDEDFNLQIDDQHCGHCGISCAIGWYCSNGGCFQECVPSPEICNGLDDDCDNATDENLGQTTCGVGACSRTVTNCLNSVPQVCVPGNPAAETCNNVDDDCNGDIDHYTITCETACGQGNQCCRFGLWDSCTAPLPANEICDGFDNDCNGVVDDGIVCIAGGGCNPVPETCNGSDDDCDGARDENLGSTACGVGACRRTVQNCVGGVPQVCVPGNPAAETCNNVDDDCNNIADENLTRDCSTACENGTQTCGNGLWGTCSARQPSIESCNGIDDDCDTFTDEGGVCGGCGLPNTVTVEVDSGVNGAHTIWTDLEGAGPDCSPEWEESTDNDAPYTWTYQGDTGPRIVSATSPNGVYYVTTQGARGVGDCATAAGWTFLITVNGVNVPVPAYEPGNPVDVIEAGAAALAHEETGWCNAMICLGNNPCEANCLDGLDNDGDNLTDCLDWDCHWFWSNGACP